MDDGNYDLIDEPGGYEGLDTSPAPADTGSLDYDLPCRHCGYNLRGLDVSRACPECGTAVGRSLLGDQLRYSDPQWVSLLAKGANLILWSVLVRLLLGIVGFFAGITAATSGAQTVVFQHVMVYVSVIPALMSLAGVWLVTSPEPGVIEQANLPLRNLLRFAAVFSFVIGMMRIGIAGEGLPVRGWGIIAIFGGIIGLIGYVALFVFARRLALRVPDYDLARQTKTVMWGIIICMGSGIVFGVLAGVLGSATGGSGAAIMIIPICGVAIAYMVFAIWSLLLLFRYRRVSLEAVDEARRTWATV